MRIAINKNVDNKTEIPETTCNIYIQSVMYFLTILTTIIAIAVSWTYNKYESYPKRLAYAFFAGYFGFWYLLYFVLFN